MKLALKFKINKLQVYGDSMLIIYQVKGKWQTKDEKLRQYQEYLSKLVKEFDEIKFTHMGRDKNQFVNALTTLASMTKIDYRNKVQPISVEVRNSLAYCYSVE
jgi:ribonuclease HI